MKKKQQTRLNENITVPNVRLIDADGTQLGIVSIRQALEHASNASLDLVEISPNAEPPVCRIMDHGKYIFELNKKKAIAKKKQKQIQVKEVKLRPGTEEADYQVKLKRAVAFLEHGDKVKFSIRFRGREMAHQELGMDVMKRLAESLIEHGEIEQKPKMEGRQMIMIVGPK